MLTFRSKNNFRFWKRFTHLHPLNVNQLNEIHLNEVVSPSNSSKPIKDLKCVSHIPE